MFDQALVEGVVDMAVQHVGGRGAVPVQPVLAVVAEDRVMGEDDFSFLVMELFVGPYPFKKLCAEFPALDHAVMISENQVFSTVQLFQKLIGLLGGAQGKISQDHHLVFVPDLPVPLADHVIIHGRRVRKASPVHLRIQIFMKKMTVCNIITHQPSFLFSISGLAAYRSAVSRVIIPFL